MTNFSHIHVYSASLRYPMPIIVIDPDCSQAILPMRVTPFPSGMLYVTNIPSTNGNDTLFCSEVNGKYSSENFEKQITRSKRAVQPLSGKIVLKIWEKPTLREHSGNCDHSDFARTR